ncbi:LysR family transcriptional regulator [Actinomadura hallensis]|uniref:LysR family transcriptional regulator n=1 Tax=Actinomadura hallensis TaxID=337895 RepID=A0A543IDL8_9ACTN|nr:LysR substrate-binding domain-containing protein [Actinomadura hallensis]TQM68679.1 LysR family transcriptional regulator [Actinomadura hallensis]HLV74159.1 LysR substrate-binding domain-containing protein [Vulgatibacteraceae bacterium]
MDIGQLRAFLVVAEELHFGRAAERLHMAQPPLSRTIKQLERELGTTLFDRNTRRVELTASGRALLGPAAEVLDAMRRAEAAVRSAASGDSGVVRIAFAGVSTHRLVARLARAVRSRLPGIRLELSSQQFAQPALRKLQQGETDLALGRWDVVPGDLQAEVVMTDSLVLALPGAHPLARNESVSVADLAGEQFVSLSPLEGSVMPERLRRLAAEHGFFPEIVQIAPDTQTALALVSAEVGCHLTLASVAANAADPHLRFVPVADEAPDVHLRMAWRRSETDPALHAVRRQLAALE